MDPEGCLPDFIEKSEENDMIDRRFSDLLYFILHIILGAIRDRQGFNSPTLTILLPKVLHSTSLLGHLCTLDVTS